MCNYAAGQGGSTCANRCAKQPSNKTLTNAKNHPSGELPIGGFVVDIHLFQKNVVVLLVIFRLKIHASFRTNTLLKGHANLGANAKLAL